MGAETECLSVYLSPASDTFVEEDDQEEAFFLILLSSLAGTEGLSICVQKVELLLIL